MKSFLLTAGMSLLLVTTSLASSAPPFPWRTYNEAAKAVTSTPIPACENGGKRVEFGEEWIAFSWPDRDLFIHYTDGIPDYVYLIAGMANGPMKIKDVMTLEHARARFPGPCAYGDEKEV